MNDEAGGRAGERRRGRSESGVFGLPAGYGERGRWCGWCAVGWSQDRKHGGGAMESGRALPCYWMVGGGMKCE